MIEDRMLAEYGPGAKRWAACVLLVEDEVLIRALLSEELRDAGLRVVEAANADEAWAFLKADGGSVDLVFSDINMPGSMDGLELSRRIEAEYPAIKIIITSGNLGTRRTGENVVFVPKPYRIDRVAEIAMQKLGLR